MRVKKKQLELDMEQEPGSKSEKEYVRAVYCHSAYLTYMKRTSWEMLDWMKHKLKSRLLGEISVTSDMMEPDAMILSFLSLRRIYIEYLVEFTPEASWSWAFWLLLGGFWLLTQSPYFVLVCSSFLLDCFGKLCVSKSLLISSGWSYLLPC